MHIARIPCALLIAGALGLPALSALAEGLINVNTADAATLDTLPGIGPTKAQAIIDYREQNGPFASIEDIQNVSGIGPATYADIAPLITVGDTGKASGTGQSADTSSSTAVLAYPDGTPAASYPPGAQSAPPPQTPAPLAAAAPVQRDPPLTGSSPMQTVEPALTSPNAENHADAPAADSSIGAAAGAWKAEGLLRSGWLYGILGILALAGGALLIL